LPPKPFTARTMTFGGNGALPALPVGTRPPVPLKPWIASTTLGPADVPALRGSRESGSFTVRAQPSAAMIGTTLAHAVWKIRRGTIAVRLRFGVSVMEPPRGSQVAAQSGASRLLFDKNAIYVPAHAGPTPPTDLRKKLSGHVTARGGWFVMFAEAQNR